MKRVLAFVAISLLNCSISSAGTLTLQDCREAVANSKKEVKFPSKLDEFTEFTDMKCGSELYMGKPTYEYFYKITTATKNQLRPDFQKAAKTAIFRDTCTQNFNSLSEFANRKYIYIDSKGEKVTEVFISSDECTETPAARLAIKASTETQENRTREKVSGLMARDWAEVDRVKKANEIDEEKQKERFASEPKQTGLIAAVAIKEESQIQKEVENALAKKDDATCKSYGAKKGTQAYIQCRVSLVASRQEAADRQKTIDALEKRINLLQSQIQSQSETQSDSRDRDQRLSNERYTSDQEFKNKQIELQQEQLRTLQQQQTQAKEAARWESIRQLNDPAQWNQQAPPLPTVPRKLNCQKTGANTTCW